MAAASDKVMFEAYCEAGFERQYRVTYFTELNDHNKDREINRAMNGSYFMDGFLPERRKAEGKEKLSRLVERLNAGEEVEAETFESELVELGLMTE